MLVLGQINEKISENSKASNYSKELEDLNQKLSAGLSRLEDLLLARELEKTTDQLTFATINLTPAHPPPVGAVSGKPFFSSTSPAS